MSDLEKGHQEMAVREPVEQGRRMRRFGRSALIAAGLAALLPAATLGVTLDLWNGSWATEYPDNYTCVSASAVTWVNYISGNADYGREKVLAYYAYGRTKDLYYYPLGIDPRGWAWIMWSYAQPTDAGFNDYGYASQAAANAHLAMGLWTTQEPVGAIVDKGVHAILLVGTSSEGEWSYNATLNGFYAIDPWYDGVHNGSWSRWGAAYNFAPNTFITIGAWNAYYFLPYHEAGQNVIWEGQYLTILKSSAAVPPSDTPPAPYSDLFSTAGLPAAASGPEKAGAVAASTFSYAVDSAYASVDAAIAAGIRTNRLAEDSKVGSRVARSKPGKRVAVKSYSDGMPSYELVELVTDGRTTAVAMVTRAADGWHLAAVQATMDDFQMLDTDALGQALRAHGGPDSKIELAWERSEGSPSPFSPTPVASDGKGSWFTLGPDGKLRHAASVEALLALDH